MSDDEIFSVAKEISDRFVAEWDRLKGDRVPWHMSEVQERVFFEIFLHVVNARHMTTNDVVEVIKVYLRHADWIGLLICDSSPSNGNGSHGPTWALVRPRGLLASFGGSPFQAIYEPLYEIHGEEDDQDSEEFWDDDEQDLTPEERKKRSNEVAENYLKKGNTVFVEGRIRKREYEDKDGIKRYVTDIQGDNMTMLNTGPRPQVEPGGPETEKTEDGNGNGVVPTPEDDLPF